MAEDDRDKLQLCRHLSVYKAGTADAFASRVGACCALGQMQEALLISHRLRAHDKAIVHLQQEMVLEGEGDWPAPRRVSKAEQETGCKCGWQRARNRSGTFEVK